MLTKMSIEQKMLILAIIFLPISEFIVKFPFVEGDCSKLFLFIGMCISIYKIFMNKESITAFEKFSLYFLLIFFLWQCICTIIGIIEYDFYSMVYLEQMDKLRYLTQTLNGMGIVVSDITVIKLWLSFRFIKDCALQTFFSYGIAIWVYHIYIKSDSDFQKKESIYLHIILAISILCIVLSGYSIFEIGYLRGNSFCADILRKINPLLYNVADAHGWWPPLLWKGQLRSLFPEPSFFGLISVLVVPFLFYSIMKFKKNFFFYCIYGLYLLMLFLTKARTALVLFMLQSLLFYLFILKSQYGRKALKIFFISVFSFLISVYLIAGFKGISNYEKLTDNSNMTTEILKYVDNNITSVVGNKRSNNARFANVRATFLTGVKHPLFGVGKGMSDAYVSDNFTEEDMQNNEVRWNWIYYMREKGVLKSPIPVLNQFTIEIAQFGIPGLLMYIFPIVFILKEMYHMLKYNLDLESVCVSIAYIGSVVALFPNKAFLTYYILTGTMVLLLHNERKERKINNESN